MRQKNLAAYGKNLVPEVYAFKGSIFICSILI